MVSYFRIHSWHILRLTRSIEPRSLCGRRGKADAETSTTLPAEKSCESCLLHPGEAAGPVIAIRFHVWWHTPAGMQAVGYQHAIGWVH